MAHICTGTRHGPAVQSVRQWSRSHVLSDGTEGSAIRHPGRRPAPKAGAVAEMSGTRQVVTKEQAGAGRGLWYVVIRE